MIPNGTNLHLVVEFALLSTVKVSEGALWLIAALRLVIIGAKR